jgi:hypothetical protein
MAFFNILSDQDELSGYGKLIGIALRSVFHVELQLIVLKNGLFRLFLCTGASAVRNPAFVI